MAGPSKYETFDRSRLRIQPLSRRQNDLAIGHWLALGDPTPPFEHADLAQKFGIRAGGGLVHVDVVHEDLEAVRVVEPADHDAAGLRLDHEVLTVRGCVDVAHEGAPS